MKKIDTQRLHPVEYQLLVTNQVTGETYDLTKRSTSITHTTQIWSGNPGELTAELVYVEGDTFFIPHGSRVVFKVDGETVFVGNSVKIQGTVGASFEKIYMMKALDQKFYLKSASLEYRVYETLDEFFTRIMGTTGLNFSVEATSSYILPPKVFDNYTVWAMLQRSVEETNIGEAKFGRMHYIIRDVAGVLKLQEMRQLITDVTFGDNDYVIQADFVTEISSNTYNKIIGVQEDQEVGVKWIHTAKDSDSMNAWGTLVKQISVPEGKPIDEAKTLIEDYLEFHNTPTETLSMQTLWKPGILAGNGFKVILQGLDVSGNFWATKVTDRYINNMAYKDMEVFFVSDIDHIRTDRPTDRWGLGGSL